MRVLLKELPDQDVRLVGGDRLAALFLNCRGLLGERAELKRMKPVFDAFQQHPQGIRYVRQGRAEAVVGVPSVVGIFEQGRRVKTGRLAPPGKIVRLLDELPEFFGQYDRFVSWVSQIETQVSFQSSIVWRAVAGSSGGAGPGSNSCLIRSGSSSKPPDSSEAFFFPMLSV